jgi:hypothetical protein
MYGPSSSAGAGETTSIGCLEEGRERRSEFSQSADHSSFPNQILLYTEIERLMKAFKGHRCALDFDRGFVHSELRNAKIWIAELFGRSLLWDNVCRCKKHTKLYARRVECETCHTKMILQYLHHFEIPGIL